MEPTATLDNPSPAPGSATHWSLIALLLAAAFVFGLRENARSVIVFYALDAQTSTSMSNAVALVSGAFSISLALCSLLAGWLIGRLGYNRLFILGASGVLLGLIGWAVNPPWPLHIVFEGLIGAGQGLIMTAAIAYIVTLSKPVNLFVLLVAVALGSLVGGLIFSIASGVLMAYGLAPMLAYNALVLVSMTLLAVFITVRWRWRTYMPTGEAIWFYSIGQTLRTWQSWLLLLMFLMAAASTTALSQGMLLYTSQRASVSSVALFLQAILVANLSGLVIAAGLSRRRSLFSLMVISLVGAGIAVVRVASLPDDASGYGFFSFFAAPLYALAILHAYRVLGVHHLPGMIGIQAAVNVLALPVLIGLLNVIVASPLYLSALLIVCLAIFALAYWWTLRSEAVHKKKADDFAGAAEIDPIWPV